MSVTRRDLFAYGTAGAISVLAPGKPAMAAAEGSGGEEKQVPAQVASDRAPRAPGASTSNFGSYDMRRNLKPGRLTLACWGVDYALRHMPGAALPATTACSMRPLSAATTH
jgi:hypothetical protein